MTDLEASQENSREVVGHLSQLGDYLDQTFTMRRPRLNSLTVWASKDNADPSVKDKTSLPLQINLYLYPLGQSSQITRTVAVSTSGPLYLTFPPQNAPPEQIYLVRLTATQGGIDILGINSDI